MEGNIHRKQYRRWRDNDDDDGKDDDDEEDYDDDNEYTDDDDNKDGSKDKASSSSSPEHGEEHPSEAIRKHGSDAGRLQMDSSQLHNIQLALQVILNLKKFKILTFSFLSKLTSIAKGLVKVRHIAQQNNHWSS